jgi:hypothetical protein
LVVPAAIPVTAPVVLTVPMAVVPLLQVPPGVVFDNMVDCPTQVVVVPVMGAGTAFTVATVVK